MLVACDVDGVVCDLMTPWLGRYNAIWHDHLALKDIVKWDLHTLVKPECGKQIYNHLRTDLYSSATPEPGAKEGIDWLREQGHRVVFVTTCVKKMTDFKWEWLEKWGFLPRGRHNQDDLVVAADKLLVNADILIDDRADTIDKWVEQRRKPGLLFSQPWNENELQDKHSMFWMTATRVSGWPAVIQYMMAKDTVAV